MLITFLESENTGIETTNGNGWCLFELKLFVYKKMKIFQQKSSNHEISLSRGSYISCQVQLKIV